MLSEIFYWVLNVSIISSIVGLIVLALRKIKALPKFAVYLLWIIPLLRFWMPFGIANPYSLLTLISKFATKTVVIWEQAPEFTMTNSIMSANSYFPIEYKTNILENIFNVASVIWIIVAGAAILTAFLLYYYTKTELRTAVLVKDNIYKSDKITAPAVYGFIRPKIIIPSTIAEENIEYIVMHEKVHIRRYDNLFRIIAVITACVHWFNPLVWIFLQKYFTDMELACDAKVLKSLNQEQTKSYALSILSCSANKTFFASAFGGAKARVRIESILSYKKLTLISFIFFALLFAAVVVVLMTNATI